MAVSWEIGEETHKQVTWNDLSRALQHTPAEKTAADIAHCLRLILKRFEESEFITYLVIPSPSSMALYFQTSINEIYQAMTELSQQGFQTETSSNYAPILLWDPIIRKKIQHSLDPQ